MAVYRRGKTWWFVFEFQGQRLQESSGFTNKTAALRAEARRKRICSTDAQDSPRPS